MSSENVEVARRAFDVLANERDVDAGLQYIDEEVELRSAVVGGAEGNTYRGHDGIREWMGESEAIWEELHVDLDELDDLGDHVLMVGRMRARGRGSGLEMNAPIGWLFELRDARIVRARGYLDIEEARRSAAALAAQ